ncbi:MAG TPA: AAA family ATPase [Candidatus Deferrimicrobium sp.]|nr:AAA family ATPase [Candidatus Deferrimicrobium sp.]
MSTQVILITGPRAAGKSTFAAEVHQALVGSVLLHVDEPFHQVMDENREQWAGKEIGLYAVILRHQLALARDLALEGSCVVVDATVLPNQLDPVRETPAPDVSVVVLLPSLEECLANEHRATRTVPVREEKVTATWQEMQEWRRVTGVSVRIVEGLEVERRKALSTVVNQLQWAF